MFFITDQLKKKYGFYAKYHKNFLNKLTHLICIPLLAFSAFIMMDYIPFEFNTNKYFNNTNFNNKYINNTNFNKLTYKYKECYGILKPSSVLYIIYFFYYIYLTPFIGLLANLFYLFIFIISQIFYCKVDYAYVYAIGIHVASWLIQLLGHKLCEGNRPAFLTGLVDSFMVAPLFVVIDFCKLFCFYCCPCLELLTPDKDNIEIISEEYLADNTLGYSVL